VLETSDGVLVVITTRKANQLDYELYRHVGLDIRTAKVVQVKSAGGYRAFYEPLAHDCIDLATPGPADSRLPRLPYTRRWRPLYPFDDAVPEPFVAAPSPEPPSPNPRPRSS
jgi:microcystin degradation protein MlrC